MDRHAAIEEREGDSAGASSAQAWLRQVLAFAERCLREVGNSWTMLSVVLALPAGMQLLFGAQLGDAPPELISAWAVGTGVFGAIYVCLYIFGYQLAGDLEDQRYAAYRSMPLSPSADLCGRMLASLALAAAAFALTIVAGVLTGGSFAIRGPESLPIIVLAFLLTCIFWMVVALPFVAYAKNERVAEYAVPMIAVLAYVLTGLNGVNAATSPIDGDLLNYLPNALPTRVLSYHLVPAGDWAEIGLAPPSMPVGSEFVAVLVAYAAVALVVGTVVVNRALYDRGWWP